MKKITLMLAHFLDFVINLEGNHCLKEVKNWQGVIYMTYMAHILCFFLTSGFCLSVVYRQHNICLAQKIISIVSCFIKRLKCEGK